MMKTNSDAFAECGWCGRGIRYGSACVTIDHCIQQADWDEGHEGPTVTVIRSEALLVLCAACGNRFDTDALREALERRASANPLAGFEAPEDQEERAWKEYPPEAAAYGDYLRRVMWIAIASFAHLGQFTDTPPADLITNAVIDYEGEEEGCAMHQGRGASGFEAGWWDPSYSHVGSCSRSVRESVELAVEPYPTSLHDRAFSMVTLDRPTWIPPDDEGSFYEAVVEPLVDLPPEADHLYGWLDVFFRFAAGKRVAYFARYHPGDRIWEVARKHGVDLFPMPLAAIPEGEREEHRRFRFLWVTRAEWEELNVGLEEQAP